MSYFDSRLRKKINQFTISDDTYTSEMSTEFPFCFVDNFLTILTTTIEDAAVYTFNLKIISYETRFPDLA